MDKNPNTTQETTDVTVEKTNLLTVRKIVEPVTIFHYKNLNDVKSLGEWLNTQVKLNGDYKPKLGKFIIEEDSYLFKNEENRIINVRKCLTGYKELSKK